MVKEAIRQHFQLDTDDINDDEDDRELFHIKIQNQLLTIEVCERDSYTVKDLGEDSFSYMLGNEFLWRWY